MSDYENAPATKMLATHCVCCNRPLLDAQSVELGIGPECRKRHGYNARGVSEENRAQANKLVAKMALPNVSFTDLTAALTELSMLGFQKLAAVIASRKASISIALAEEGRRLLVKTPFTAGSLVSIRAIPGRGTAYNEDNRFLGNTFPVAQKGAVWNMIRRHFPGALGVGPKGPFTVPTRDEDTEPVQVGGRVDAYPKGCCQHCGDPEFHDGEPCHREPIGTEATDPNGDFRK